MASANQGGSPSPTSPRRISAAAKQAEALKLRKAGQTLVEIAEKLGYASDAGVRKAIRKALEKTVKQPADEVRWLIEARNEEMMKVVFPRALEGDLEAVNRVIKINRETAAINGLISTKLKVGQDPEADPVGVNVYATLEMAVYDILKRLTPDERRLVNDVRERLVGPAGGNGESSLNGVGQHPPTD